MCNDYRLTVDVASIIEEFADLKIKIVFSEGAPNIEARQDIKITDVAPIVRTIEGSRNQGDLVQRRWSWPGPNKRPVYNFRSDGRELVSGRCLIVADGFYEFTAPADPKKKRKDKWLFTMRDNPIFCVAGIWRETKDVGQAFTMLTMEPGPDIAPYHDRQIVIVERDAWADWLDPSVSAQSIIGRCRQDHSLSSRSADAVHLPHSHAVSGGRVVVKDDGNGGPSGLVEVGDGATVTSPTFHSGPSNRERHGGCGPEWDRCPAQERRVAVAASVVNVTVTGNPVSSP